jgi:hypothetical protein
MLPLWKADEEIADTARFCQANGFDEVAWILEPPDRFGFVVSPAELRTFVPALQAAKARLEAEGIASSIDNAHTLGHGDVGNDHARQVFPVDAMMVGHDGSQCHESTCPLSPSWQRWAEEFFGIMAATRPHRIWIDDDFRFFNHKPAHFTCYCPAHLKAFGERTGRPPLTRQELVSAILQPGVPHPLRSAWFDFLSDTLAATIERIRRIVHRVSPGTHVCMMTTTPFLHELEGRDHVHALRSAAGPHPPAVRLATSGYQDGSLRNLYVADEALKRIAPCLPPETLAYTEIESMPYYSYAKSIAWVEAQAVWATVVNVPRHTFNLYDRLGSQYAEQPDYGAALKAIRPYLEAVASVFCAPTVPAAPPDGAIRSRGVRLLSHRRSAGHVRTTAGCSFWDLEAKDSGWADALRAFGMPITFSGDEAVVAVTGHALRGFEDVLPEIFARGVLLDLSGLATLIEMGGQDWVGVEIDRVDGLAMPAKHIAHEALTDPAFGGGPDVFTYCHGVCRRYGVLRPRPGARVVSEIRGLKQTPLFPGVVLYENRLGGRVAVYPYEFVLPDIPDMYVKATSPAFYSNPRRSQLRAVVAWLARDEIPLTVDAEGWILPHRADGADTVGLAAMNLNLDPWQKVTLKAHVTRPVKEVMALAPGGEWKPCPKRQWEHKGEVFDLRLRVSIPPLKVAAAALLF